MKLWNREENIGNRIQQEYKTLRNKKKNKSKRTKGKRKISKKSYSKKKRKINIQKIKNKPK